MKFLGEILDLGPCEGRWITAFGTHRGCSYRASESFDSPCGHTHRLCATCVYALQRGLGTWDSVSDFLYHGTGPGAAGTPETGPNAPASAWLPSAPARPASLRGRGVPRSAAKIPLNVMLCGIAAVAATVMVFLPNLALVAPTAAGTAVLLYVVMARHAILK